MKQTPGEKAAALKAALGRDVLAWRIAAKRTDNMPGLAEGQIVTFGVENCPLCRAGAG